MKRYISTEKSRNPNYLKIKNTFGEVLPDADEREIFEEHERVLESFENGKIETGNYSLLEIKHMLLNLQPCCLCENRCMVDRRTNLGKCGVYGGEVASAFLHFGEERMLVPSGTIFFGGCPFKCVFCQNYDISQNFSGRTMSDFEISQIAEKLYHIGARNINWVGGDPIPHIPKIVGAMRFLEIEIPMVFNSNMYMTEKTLRLLSYTQDLFLTDFKYGNNRCAKRYSGIDNYTEIVKRNHIIAERYADLLIRHLVLPNHLECCTRKIFEWISDNLKNYRINIMNQYTPYYRAIEYTEISRKISDEEFEEALKIAKDVGIDDKII